MSFITVANEIAQSPYTAAARAVVEAQQARRAAHPTAGVSWSAMTSPAPEVETVEAVAARLEQRANETKRWLASPLGRFYCAIQDLGKLGYDSEHYLLDAIYRSSLADESQPLDTAACGSALTILEKINHPDAREAALAIAELLMGRPLLMAAE